MHNVLRFFGHRAYIRFGIRNRLIRFFHNPDNAKEKRFEVNFFGYRYLGNFNCYIDWNVYYYGAYSGEELQLLYYFLTAMSNPITLDIGANVGHHTLFAAKFSKSVYAFEPFKPLAEKIREKLEINHLTNVFLCPVGLGNSTEILEYYAPTSNNTGTGSFVKKTDSMHDISQQYKLQVVKGDEYLLQIGVDKVDFIKMDIEGFEVYALMGLMNTLKKSRPIIFMEWSQISQSTLVKDFDDLFPENYKFYQFLPQPPQFIFFQKRSYELHNIRGLPHEGSVLAIPAELDVIYL